RQIFQANHARSAGRKGAGPLIGGTTRATSIGIGSSCWAGRISTASHTAYAPARRSVHAATGRHTATFTHRFVASTGQSRTLHRLCDRLNTRVHGNGLAALHYHLIESNSDHRRRLPFRPRLRLRDVTDDLCAARDYDFSVRKQVLSYTRLDPIALLVLLSVKRFRNFSGNGRTRC